MKHITLKQLIYTIDIRDFDDSIDTDSKYDCYIVRFRLDNSDNWLDIGWYDFDNKENVWNRLKLFLNDKILNSIVTRINYDFDINVINIYLDEIKDKDEDELD